MRLSPNFDLSEFVTSQEAARRGIDNTPPQEIINALSETAHLLEQVRKLLGTPIIVSSGYRCAPLNKAVGGVWNSAHVTGQAADFTSPGFGPPVAIWRAIEASSLKFDQCIIEFNSWVHLAWSAENRRQVFVIS